jgi:hypothetical protein
MLTLSSSELWVYNAETAFFQVHYHIIPAPDFTKPKPQAASHDHRTVALTQKEMHKAEFESREELDEDDASRLVANIRARL